MPIREPLTDMTEEQKRAWFPPLKRGFAALPKEKHLAYSAKGGKAKVPKGIAKLSPEARSQRAREAANALWEKRRREAAQAEAINPAGDGRPNSTSAVGRGIGELGFPNDQRNLQPKT